ncbi:TetR family transcriptional regulator [Evansella sp. LMS18]|uniref:TetR family transcriptional regulator n=1 Tax=Evansella sp. LMS18 TaxID=2924033 RepID=UPI0020D07D7D|nr:TetR family transcriptional regulator [Evansella sp. LMS18]UTR08624.1 TetR family transcriptional regulator [Evansella sp. LMS18]
MGNVKNEKYEKLLDAAFKVMQEKGFEKASVSHIVKEAGVAQGTFYLYFSSKSAVVPAMAEKILHEQLAELKGRLPDETDIYETIRSIIDVSFEMTERYKEVIIFCYSGMAFHHSFDRWEQIYLPYYSWLEARLQHAAESKAIQTDVKMDYLAKMIVGLIENSAENCYLSQQEGSPEQYKEEVNKFILKALQQ